MNPRRADEDSRSRQRRAGGRPRKYSEPSQPVTVTLPRTTLRQLEEVDADRGRAIVKLAKEASRGTDNHARVELVDVGGGTGVVVVGAAPIFESISFLRLVEVGPGRHLIAVLPGHNVHELELALTDLKEDLDTADIAGRELLTKLLNLLKKFRKSAGVGTAQILLLRLAATSEV